MGDRGTPLEVGHRIVGCSIVDTDVVVDSAFLSDGQLDGCSEAGDIISWCGCWTYVAGTRSGDFWSSGFVGVMEGEGCVGGFKLSRIVG